MRNTFLRNIFYSSPAFAFAIPTFPVMIMLPAFFSEVHDYSVSKIGMYLFLAKLLDIISDPIMGWINDRGFFSKKILLFAGAILSGLALYKLFLLSEIPYESYLFVWISVLYIGWTMFQIPYLSLGYEIERNYFSRTKLSAAREFFILLGLFFSLGLPMIFDFTNEILLRYLVYVAFISGLVGLFLLVTFIPERKLVKKTIIFRKLFDNIRKNKQLLKIISIWFINSLANVLPMILFAFFITYFLGGDDSRRQEVLFYYFLFSVLGVPFWTILSKKLGKTKTWSISLFFSALFFVGVLFLNQGDFVLFIFISCITGFCLGADLILPPSIQADITDIHLARFKEDISGILFSMITFINKFSFAIASLFVFGILGILDFQPNEEVNKSSKNFILISYSLFPILLKLFAIYLLRKVSSNESEIKKIQKKIYG